MKVAVDETPIRNNRILSHRVRGTGFYIENLKKSLFKYDLNNKYIFFTRGELIPKDVDLVHYPYFEPFFLTLPVFNKYKTVVTVHDLTPLVFPKEFPSGLKGKVKWEVQKQALRNADGIITDSECSKKDIAKHTGIPTSKIHVVYLAAGEGFRKMENVPRSGIPLCGRKWKMEMTRKYNLPEKFILYVGDVTWNKNLPRLIEAIKKINVTLVMVGSALVQKEFDRLNPWNQDLLKVQKQVENDKRIIRLGFIPTEDLVTLYNLATVFVMPSLYEGFGLPILEAMSCGCPVVTTREGSIPEVAGDGAYYVDACDINEIANGIGEVYFNQKLQRELSQKGLRQVQKFGWEETAKNTTRIYEKVVMER